MKTPFRAIVVETLIEGGTRILWSLAQEFQDPLPYRYQLQHGTTGNPDADDWANVGPTQEDVFFIIDPVKRVFGKTQEAHYRVVLSTPLATYISGPADMRQWLNHYQWRMAQSIFRKERLQQRRFTAIEGYLLFRRRFGPICTDCTDPATKEILDPNCDTCFGTGIEGGYFDPLPAQYAEISLRVRREKIDESGLGTSKGISQTARFLGYPKLHSYDVWVDRRTDERYYIHTVQDAARVGNAPVVQMAEIRLAPFSDIVYRVPMPHSGIGTRTTTHSTDIYIQA